MDDAELKKFKDKFKRPVEENLDHFARRIADRTERAIRNGGDTAANVEMFAQCIAVGALYRQLRGTLGSGDRAVEALLDQLVEETSRDLAARAAAALAVELKR